MRVYRVHVPTLSVDGLIRIYMAHTAQIIYIICKILALFFMLLALLCSLLYHNSRPSTPNSKARYMSTSAATHKRDTLLLPMQPMAVSPLVYFQ